MFYSVFVLGKKGPLARVWLAAHWDKKITKAQILETNITESVDSILQPRVKLSLRTSSHLLLGIVRIYARKTLYLLQDCQDAAFKIKSAFRPGAVDLPEGKTEAHISAITLPEMLDFMINDFDLIAEPQINLDNLPAAAQLSRITLEEEPANLNIDDPLMPGGDWSEFSSNQDGRELSNVLDSWDKQMPNDFDAFDDEEIFPPAPQEKEAPPPTPAADLVSDKQPPSHRPPSSASSNGMSFEDDGPASNGVPSTPGTPGGGDIGGDMDDGVFGIRGINDDGLGVGDDTIEGARLRKTGDNSIFMPSFENKIQLADISSEDQPMKKPALRGRAKRKGALLIDDPKTLSGEEMKAQLSDTSDTVCTLDLAPPSKKMMNWKKTGGSEKLFALPERFMPSELLQTYFTRHCFTRQIAESEDHMLLPPLSEPLVNGELAAHVDDQEFEPEYEIPPTPGGLGAIAPRTPRPKTPSKQKKRPREKADKEAPKRPAKSQKVDGNHFGEDIERGRDITRDGISDVRHPTGISDLLDDDDDDGYYPPNSVGPLSVLPPDDDEVDPDLEQEEDETAEQFEERIQNRRTNVLLRFMVQDLDAAGEVLFGRLVRANRKKVVAQKFFSLLVLKKQQAIELTQEVSPCYAEIRITKGMRYDEALASSQL